MSVSSVFIKKRIAKLFVLLAGVIFLLFLRLGYIQFVKGDELQKMALDNRLREVVVEAKRGAILDRNHRELAVSVSSDSVVAFPPQIKRTGKAEQIAEQVAEILEMDKEEVLKKITQNSSCVWIRRKIDDFEKSRKIKELDLDGIEVVEESRRFYPNGSLACHVLGFVGIDNQGLEGLEVTFDDELKGVPGRIVMEFDAAGRKLPQAVHRYIPSQDGNNLVLTIDETIQYVVERELDQLMNSSVKPKGAAIIVMNPKTGEILALGCRPSFDPNNFNKYSPKTWRNFAVSDSYEPGSTFKIITAAAALEEGVIRDGEKFNDPGYIKVGTERIRCWSSVPHGVQTFEEGMMNSCNPVLAAVGLRLMHKDRGLFYKYIKAFGFGKATGIALPGEAEGLLIPLEQLKEINIATISIGQGISVTPIQMITAVSAVANGGNLMKPLLVKEIRDKNGKIIEKFEPQKIRQVISQETSKKLCSILEKVVNEGTGKRAYIEGYRAAGKTGTAQKVGKGGYVPGKYVASFVGFAPANDPQVAALVVVDEPQGYPYYGGTVAAPIFKRVVEDALHYLGIPKQDTGDPPPEIPGEERSQPREDVEVPDIVGLTLDEARQKLAEARLEGEIVGRGERVQNQLPKPGAVVKEGTKVIIYLDQKSSPEVLVPDVRNKRIFEAADVLESLGLKLVPHGSGKAYMQKPAPNTKIKRGSSVEVWFKEEQ
ncbi:MAG TPA: stage V sporulation protein D [Peptococcaceae bacterium]|nr:MAG: Stage V sporulation protein D [Clostridia bacterium 41_269]HBT20117.1 stage V sporulation protein D [Peptococcaceae bacterium]